MRARRDRGFTLIELLVVIGIIGVLISMLLPALARARQTAISVRCQSNLRQIFISLEMYANDNRTAWPDAYTLGSFSFRVRPGRVEPFNDPHGLPEDYGVQAILHGIRHADNVPDALSHNGRYLSATSDVYICGGAADWMKDYGNTYANWTNSGINPTLTYRRKQQDVWYLWDNAQLKPFISGFRGGSATGYTLPASQRPYPHKAGSSKLGRNVLHMGGYVTLESGG